MLFNHVEQVLCTTTTLAVGVNLPARLVVVKGTRRWAAAGPTGPAGYEEYDRSTCLQMIGRCHLSLCLRHLACTFHPFACLQLLYHYL